MTDPITPPQELIERWLAAPEYSTAGRCTHISLTSNRLKSMLTKAAQWGANQELEACREWLREDNEDGFTADLMHEARRPKPPDLKQQALKDLDLLMADLRTLGMGFRDTNIRLALEALNG